MDNSGEGNISSPTDKSGEKANTINNNVSSTEANTNSSTNELEKSVNSGVPVNEPEIENYLRGEEIPRTEFPHQQSQEDQENTPMPPQEILMNATSDKNKNIAEQNRSSVSEGNWKDQEEPSSDQVRIINEFRDQTNLKEGESIPETVPTPLSEENKSDQETLRKTAETLDAINKILSELNRIKAQFPNDTKIQETILNITNNLSTLLAESTKNIKVEKQDTIKKEILDEEAKQKRDTKKAALIAKVVGGVGGFGTVMALGTAAVGPATVVLAVGSISSLGARFISTRAIKKINDELKNEKITNEEKERLEKRLSNWTKVNTWATHGLNFFKGFGLGLAGGTIISSAFMGGHGLVEKLSTQTATAQTTTSGINASEQPMLNTEHTTVATPTAETVRASISPSETGLIQNNRINLPGSAWNGNLAGGPTGTLPGGELLHSNFAGGQYNMAAYHFNEDLANAGLKVADVTEKVGTSGVHQLLNGYLRAIQSGVTDPSLTSVLSSSNVPGASEILNIIK